jgi:hypothetical protein
VVVIDANAVFVLVFRLKELFPVSGARRFDATFRNDFDVYRWRDGRYSSDWRALGLVHAAHAAGDQ